MKLKIAVVGLAVVVVGFVLLLVYGAVRPDGGTGDARPGVDQALGWLRDTRAVTFDDLAEADPPCLERDASVLAVGPGLTCRVDLPDSGSLTLCTQQGSATIAVVGSDFPAQRFGPGELDCAGAASIDLYDSDNRLLVACALGDACVLAVPEP